MVTRALFSLGPKYGLTAICIFFVARGLAFADFVPLWDGALYTNCVFDAVRASSIGMLNCYGHVSAIYAGILAISQLLRHEDYIGILITNMLLGTAALWAFHSLLTQLFPHVTPRTLLAPVLLLSVHPVVLASAINTNLDYGVFVFFLCYLAALLQWKKVPAIMFGLALCFSKETGVILYLASLCPVLISRGLKGGRDSAIPLATWTAHSAAYLFPPASVALFFAARMLSQSRQWDPTGTYFSDQRLTVAFNDFVMLTMLNFNWLLWLPAVLALVSLLSPRMRRRLATTTWRDTDGRVVVFAGFLLAVCGAIFLAYPTYANPRYFLVAYGVTVVLSYSLLRLCFPRRWLHQTLVVVASLIFLVSNYTTVDPISKSIYGTFPWGSHEMLSMTSISGECCGYGRDQLTYNLEFTMFHYLQDAIYRDILPNSETLFVVPRFGDWYTFARIDKGSYKRVLRADSSFTVTVLDTRDLRETPQLPDEAFFVQLPNFPAIPTSITDRYDLISVRTYEQHGYAVTVERRKLRMAPAPLGSDQETEAATDRDGRPCDDSRLFHRRT